MIINDITDAVGNTPLLKVPATITGLKNIELYAKLELLNPFGSVKDRIAVGMLDQVLPEIQSKGQRIIENSSGNTAKAIAVLAKRAGVEFKVVSALLRVSECKDILKLLGAKLEEVSGAVNCFDPSDPRDPQNLILKEVQQSNGRAHFISQFTNPLNPATHRLTTAQEILTDLKQVDYLCAGLGTAGSTIGLADVLQAANPKLKLVGIAAGKTDFIPGIRTIDQLLEAGIFEPSRYDQIISVEAQSAIDGMMLLVQKLGVLGGPSSGANFQGSLEYLRSIDAEAQPGSVAVTIVCDRLEWYLSYLRERRPSLFGEREIKTSIYNLTQADLDRVLSINASNYQAWFDQLKPLVVDIRAAIAFKQGSLPGAINIPSELLDSLLNRDSLFLGTGASVLFVCPFGEQSKRYAAQVNRLGGKGYNLELGLTAWYKQCRSQSKLDEYDAENWL